MSLRFWLKYQLPGYMPTFCSLCLKPVFDKDTCVIQHTTGKLIRICSDCDEEIHHPYTYKK